MLSVESNVSRLEKLIWSAATDSRQWPVIFNEIKECLGATAIILAKSNAKIDETRVYHSVGIEYGFIRSYEKCFAPLNPWIHSDKCNTAGDVFRGEDVFALDDLQKTIFYKEWLVPQKLFHSVSALLRKVEDQMFYLLALRPRNPGHFKDQDLHLLITLIPDLRRSTYRGEYLWQLAITLDVLDCMRFAILVIDKHARVLFSNRITKELLQNEDAMYIRDGRIYIQGGRQAQLFYRMIESAATGVEQAEVRCIRNGIMLERSEKKSPLWLIVSPLSRRLRRVICQVDQVALLYVVSPEQVSRTTEAKLESLFSLTHAEQKLIKLLLKGYRLFEAAKELDISINTARTHMKHIYAKTNTECQADLVRLFLIVPIP